MFYQPFTLRREEKEREGVPGGSECERLAGYLADRLDDWKSYRFFLSVAARVPREVILDALTRALDVPRRDIRRSRAAYFTSVIRHHLTTRAAT